MYSTAQAAGTALRRSPPRLSQTSSTSWGRSRLPALKRVYSIAERRRRGTPRRGRKRSRADSRSIFTGGLSLGLLPDLEAELHVLRAQRAVLLLHEQLDLLLGLLEDG